MNKDKNNTMKIDIIGAATDLGAGIRGAQLGPKAIRFAGLVSTLEKMGIDARDCGDVSASTPQENSNQNKLKNLKEVNEVNAALFQKVSKSYADGRFPVVLGGDHSISIGSICAAQKHMGKIGIIWVDAHGDYNTTISTPSGNIHGMPLAALTGNGAKEILPSPIENNFTLPQNAVIIGARSLDEGEKQHLKNCGVSVFSMQTIDRVGIAKAVEDAVEIAGKDTDGIYLSFDLDSIDPQIAPGVSTPVQGGLTYREAHFLCETVAQSGKLIGVDMVEHNPISDIENRTGKLAVELISSVLGKVIY